MIFNCNNIIITKNEDKTYKLELLNVPFKDNNGETVNGIITFPRVSEDGANSFKNENVLPKSEIFNVVIPNKSTIMKTNIIKTEIDRRKLQEEISAFEIINNQPAYLFMNEDTMNTITSDVVKECKPFASLNDVNDSGKLATYQGNKCYVDNDLPFGEIEIR